MSTQQLSDVVRAVIQDWVKEGKLFTALDVSLAVKQTLPFARHREVREVVRGEYTGMQASGYGRTDIDVTLDDGSTAKAMLYHPLSDSWDLDTKYSAQQRAQTLKSQSAAPAPVTAPVSAIPVTSAPHKAVTTPVSNPTLNPNKHLWDSLFDSAPSLFPRR